MNIQYNEKDGSLWLVYDDKRYMISQTSGELVGADGHTIGDLYWSDILGGSAEIVKNAFRDIANQAAALQAAEKPAEAGHQVVYQISVDGEIQAACEIYLEEESFFRAVLALVKGKTK